MYVSIENPQYGNAPKDNLSMTQAVTFRHHKTSETRGAELMIHKDSSDEGKWPPTIRVFSHLNGG